MKETENVTKEPKVLTYLLNILLITQSLSLSPLYRGMNDEERARLIEHLRNRTNYDAGPLKQQLVNWVKKGDIRR